MASIEYILGGLSSAGAVVVSNPLDVVKVRYQLQGELKARGQYHVTYRSVIHAFRTIVQVDGIMALQKGLTPALVYQFTQNSMRRGIYAQLLDYGIFPAENGTGKVSLWGTAAAGAVSGAIASGLTSPFMMLKTQFQSRAHEAIAVGYQHHHQSFRSAFHEIYSKQGIKGLWRGANALMLRIAFASATEFASFAVAKEFIHHHGIAESGTFMNSLYGSILCGGCMVVVIQPFDVIATRLYNQGTSPSGKGLYYKGFLDCILKIIHSEGPFAFYKGVSANLFRMFPHTVISLMFWDQLRWMYNWYTNKDFTLYSDVYNAPTGGSSEYFDHIHHLHEKHNEMTWTPW